MMRFVRPFLESMILLGLLVPGMVSAEEWPVFKQGQWQYDRSVTMGGGSPMTMQLSKCADPSAEMKASQSKLLSFCKPLPAAKSGNVYTYGADCATPAGRSVSKSELTAVSDTEYSLKVTTETGGNVVTEVLKAKRSADCAP